MFEKSFGQSFCFSPFQTYSGGTYHSMILDYIVRVEKSTHINPCFWQSEILIIPGCHYHADLPPLFWVRRAIGVRPLHFIIQKTYGIMTALFQNLLCIFAFIQCLWRLHGNKSSCHFDSACSETQKDFRNILLSHLIPYTDQFILVFLLSRRLCFVFMIRALQKFMEPVSYMYHILHAHLTLFAYFRCWDLRFLAFCTPTF